MQLLDAAARGTLSTPAVLEQQVRRMLADRRSEALVDNFVSQWLTLNKLAGVVPDVDAYPGIRREPARRVSSGDAAVRRRRNCARIAALASSLTANYTYVNERLARHYQIPNVYGSHFRRVDVRRRQARGTARTRQHPDRHVVSRIARRRCCAGDGCSTTSSERRHRRRRRMFRRSRKRSTERRNRSANRWKRTARTRRARCATCAWIRSASRSRTSTRWASGAPRVDALPVDASAALPDGTKFDGVAGLRQLMGESSGGLRAHVHAEADGILRSDAASNRPTFRRFGRSSKNAAPGGYRWSSLIIGIARSTPFTMSTTRAAPIRRRSRPPQHHRSSGRC